ncbi:MAG: hypothetical protein ACOY58_05490, partial [Candidatus Micrarchaeota archaeon]
GKSIFVKYENGSSAQLGGKLAVAGGMMSSPTHTGYSYDTGLKVRGKPVRQEFHLIEGIQDLKGTTQNIILPDGSTAKAEVRQVAMLDEMFKVPKKPEDPGPNASASEKARYQADTADYEKSIAKFQNDPAVKEFHKQMGTKEGRDAIFRAWNAYHELSRRIGMGDRRPPNTAMVIVEVPSAKNPAVKERIITFQPIDTGSIGWNVGRKSDGTFDFTTMHFEFGNMGTAQFIHFAAKSSELPVVQRLQGISAPHTTDGIYRQMFGPEAVKGYNLPPHDSKTISKLKTIIREHRPAQFGMNIHGSHGKFSDWMGRSRLVTNADGQMRLFAKEGQDMITALNRGSRAMEFSNHQSLGVANRLKISGVSPAQEPIGTPPVVTPPQAPRKSTPPSRPPPRRMAREPQRGLDLAFGDTVSSQPPPRPTPKEATPVSGRSSNRFGDTGSVQPPKQAAPKTPIVRAVNLPKRSAEPKAPQPAKVVKPSEPYSGPAAVVRKGTKAGIGSQPRMEEPVPAPKSIQPVENFYHDVRSGTDVNAALTRLEKADRVWASEMKRHVQALSMDNRFKAATSTEKAELLRQASHLENRESAFQSAFSSNIHRGQDARTAIENAARSSTSDTVEFARRANGLTLYVESVLSNIPEVKRAIEISPGDVWNVYTKYLKDNPGALKSLFSQWVKENAFVAMVKSSVPTDSMGLNAYVSRMSRMDPATRSDWTYSLNQVDHQLSQTLTWAIKADARGKAMLAMDWAGMVKARERHQQLNEAKAAQTPQARKASDLALIDGYARRIGMGDAAINAAKGVYTNGSTSEKLAVVERLGINVGGFRKAETKILQANWNTAQMQSQIKNLDAAVEQFFQFLLRTDVNQTIGAIPGFSGYQVAAVDYKGGLSGIFELTVTSSAGQSKKVFLKMDDAVPNRLGRDLALGIGMYTSDISKTFTYDTGLRYKDGSPINQKYFIIQDVHATKGQTIDITLPSGTREKVQVVGVRMAVDVLNWPEHPGAGAGPAELQSYNAKAADFMKSEVRKHFYGLAKSPEGMKQIFKAWNAYHELSRRIGLGDRYARNTVAMLVKRSNGELVLTFQPIDMDAVAFKIGRKNDGSPNYKDFHQDFAEANLDFLAKFSEATNGAAFNGQMSAPQSPRELDAHMASDEAAKGYRLPPPRSAQRNALIEVVRGHAGRYFGLSIPSEMFNTLIPLSWGGRHRMMGREDGRFLWNGTDMANLYSDMLRPRPDFQSELHSFVERKLP